MTLRLTIPGVPPSVNHMYRRHTLADGRRMQVLRLQATVYARDARLLAWQAVRAQGWARTPRGTQVAVRLWFYYPDRRRRDASNALKLLLDVLEGPVYEDDRDALPQIMGVAVDRESPRVEVEVVLAEVAQHEDRAATVDPAGRA